MTAEWFFIAYMMTATGIATTAAVGPYESEWTCNHAPEREALKATSMIVVSDCVDVSRIEDEQVRQP